MASFLDSDYLLVAMLDKFDLLEWSRLLYVFFAQFYSVGSPFSLLLTPTSNLFISVKIMIMFLQESL